jgi:PPM family protein phosphatase
MDTQKTPHSITSGGRWTIEVRSTAQEVTPMTHEPAHKPGSEGSAQWYVVRSETNQRENNEDSFALFSFRPAFGQPPVFVLAVADGMGGHAYGEHASREALRKVSLSLFEQLSVERAINRLSDGEMISAGMLQAAAWSALEQANVYIQRMVQANKWGKSGSTIVLAVIMGSTAIVANLGDSALFHRRAQDRQLFKVTEDHTVASVLLRAGMITPEMARYHEGRSSLEFFLGAANLPREAPIRQVALAPGDLLLLCSDGVSGAVTQEQITDVLADPNDDLNHIADRLLQIGLAAGETDNQTLILWRHGGASGGAAEASSAIKKPNFRTVQLPDMAPTSDRVER